MLQVVASVIRFPPQVSTLAQHSNTPGTLNKYVTQNIYMIHYTLQRHDGRFTTHRSLDTFQPCKRTFHRMRSHSASDLLLNEPPAHASYFGKAALARGGYYACLVQIVPELVQETLQGHEAPLGQHPSGRPARDRTERHEQQPQDVDFHGSVFGARCGNNCVVFDGEHRSMPNAELNENRSIRHEFNGAGPLVSKPHLTDIGWHWGGRKVQREVRNARYAPRASSNGLSPFKFLRNPGELNSLESCDCCSFW